MNRRVLAFLAAIGLIAGSLLVTSYVKKGKALNADKEIIVGIFGGMGPEATVDLYAKIIRETPAEKDQDHIPTLIFSNPHVPDRTRSIETGRQFHNSLSYWWRLKNWKVEELHLLLYHAILHISFTTKCRIQSQFQ